ncbi:Uncharacterised protein [Acinetobacter baumannii]|nr:Uncharacterised protein [Acinetobacter baumannii]
MHLQFQHVQHQLFAGADGTGQRARRGIGAGLLDIHPPFVDQSLQQRVVAGQLVQPLAAPQVAAAVADPHAGRPRPLHDQRHHRTADDPVAAFGAEGEFLAQAPVEPVQALAHRVQALVESRPGRQFRQAGDDHPAGQVAGLVPAHAIGDRPEPAIRAVQEGILVARADLAAIRARRAAPGFGALHQSCTGMRKLRRTARSNGFGVRWASSR